MKRVWEVCEGKPVDQEDSTRTVEDWVRTNVEERGAAREKKQTRKLQAVAAGMGKGGLEATFRAMSFDGRHYSGGMPDLTLVRCVYDDDEGGGPPIEEWEGWLKEREWVDVPLKRRPAADDGSDDDNDDDNDPAQHDPSKEEITTTDVPEFSPVKMRQQFLGGESSKRYSNGTVSCSMPKGWRRPLASLGHQKTLVYESKPAGEQAGEGKGERLFEERSDEQGSVDNATNLLFCSSSRCFFKNLL